MRSHVVLSLLLLGLLPPSPRVSFAAPQAAAEQSAPSLDVKLHTRLETYTLDADNFFDALMKIAKEFQIPMGIQWSEAEDTMKKVSLSCANVDTEQILWKLVDSHPGYTFDMSKGVIHVFPKWTRGSRRDFVNLKIQDFVVRDQIPGLANRYLRDLVKLTVSPPPPPSGKPNGSGSSMGAEVGERNISLHLQNVIVRDALDAIALASTWKVWVVTFTDDPLTPTGFRPTRTIWISNFPPNEQPVWDSLHWGDAVPPSK